MNRGLWAGVLVLAAGCQVAPVAAPVEPIPPPSRASGSWVVLEDRRAAWERTPVVGPVSLIRLNRGAPNPWAQLAAETEAVVAELPEKPERVDVVIVSYRLVKRDGPSTPLPDPSNNVRLGNKPVGTLNSRDNAYSYDRLHSATQARNADEANAVGQALFFEGDKPSLTIGKLGANEEPEPAAGSLEEHPTGASCRVRAAVRFTFPGGREHQVEVSALTSGQNLTGSRYYGEALDDAVKNAVRQYGLRLRERLQVR